MRFADSLWLAPLLALAALGCDAKPRVVPVSGVVKIDGTPMADAQVEFVPDPDKGSAGPRSTARTDNDGHFKLACDDQRDGAVVGFHRVIVQDARTFPPPRNRDSKGPPPEMPASRISDRYENAAKTPLRQEVKAEAGDIIIDVTSK